MNLDEGIYRSLLHYSFNFLQIEKVFKSWNKQVKTEFYFLIEFTKLRNKN